ncbi:glycosyltransferase family 2 protein [Streptococcus suis]|uniref:glycosyltransferase family 2 protein n=1 Tax=Streptococcus suis TaxID=1307 RepID=UPI00040C7F25|nr:glycosyltransferase family 2 protein [Streptococcus suis]
MKTNPFFSIVMPIYNAEPFLSEAIESVLHQTYQDFELILVNDASTDQSETLCQEFVASHQDKVRLYSHPENKGLLLTRATGMAEVRGQYCLCMDADDVLRADYLEMVRQTIDETQAEAVVINSSRRIDFSQKPVDYTPYVHRQMTGPEVVKEMILANRVLMTLWCTVFQSRFLPDDHFFESFQRLVCGSDLVTIEAIFSNIHHVVVLDEALYYYRFVPSSLSNSYTVKHFDSVAFSDWHFYEKYATDLPVEMAERLMRRVSWSGKRLMLSSPLSDILKNAQHIKESLFFKRAIAVGSSAKLRFSDKVFLYLVEHRFTHPMLLLYFPLGRIRKWYLQREAR